MVSMAMVVTYSVTVLKQNGPDSSETVLHTESKGFTRLAQGKFVHIIIQVHEERIQTIFNIAV
jgi:hypothetical protein